MVEESAICSDTPLPGSVMCCSSGTPGTVQHTVVSQATPISASILKATAVAAKCVGEVKYQASIASLGPEAKALLFGPEITGLLSAVFREQLAPSEDRCCLTLYREGDHLGPHRDEPAAECRIAVILYIDVRRAAADPLNTGLVLRIYGEHLEEDMRPRLNIPTTPGTLVLGRGAKFWHERPALAQGEYLAALTACYKRPGCAKSTARDPKENRRFYRPQSLAMTLDW